MGSSVILPQPGQPTEGPDPHFTSASQPRRTTFRFDLVEPPVPQFVQPHELLLISTFASVASTNRLTARILLADGSITGISLDFTCIADRAFHFFTAPLYEGFLLSVTVLNISGVATKRGQTFVQVDIARGGPANNLKEYTLLADYLQSGASLGWPGGRIESTIDGPGWLHSVQQANPAAGADWAITVPAGARWRISSFAATLTTSATVANRIVRLQMNDAAVNNIMQTAPTAVIPASTTAVVSGFPGQSTPTTDPLTINVAMPGNPILPSAFRIVTSTIGIQAGDQWSAIWFEVEDWIEV